MQTGAGAGIGFADADYERAGAKIAATAAEVFAAAEMIVKVKEPQPDECAMLRKGQVLFTYLHLAPDPRADRGADEVGRDLHRLRDRDRARRPLPLLTPMSEVAGRMSIQVGAYCLQKANGGRGVLLGGVPGVAPAKVVILGGGVVRHQRGADGRRPARRRHRVRPLGRRGCANCRRSSARRCDTAYSTAGAHRRAASRTPTW